MSTGEHDPDSPAAPPTRPRRNRADARPSRSTKLDLDVQISDVGPCKKHVKVAIPRTEIERQFKESLGDDDSARPQVPGFRPGHAPPQLIEKRFRSRSPSRSSRPC